jgi:hypothetical protein
MLVQYSEHQRFYGSIFTILLDLLKLMNQYWILFFVLSVYEFLPLIHMAFTIGLASKENLIPSYLGYTYVR